jgi:hypothetical protein
MVFEGGLNFRPPQYNPAPERVSDPIADAVAQIAEKIGEQTAALLELLALVTPQAVQVPQTDAQEPVDLRIVDESLLPHQKLGLILETAEKNGDASTHEPIHMMIGGRAYITALTCGELLAFVNRLRAVE